MTDELDALLAAYLEAVDAGGVDLEEFLAAHPEHAAALRERLAAFAAIDAAASEFAGFAVPVVPGPSNEARPTLVVPDPVAGDEVAYFGDYALVEEIARGGMGVVFRARQVSLNRTVALKMILDGAFASDGARLRFRREAEAAAGLDHPNIVDIFEVGEHEGRSYFSMRYLTGGSLAAALPTFVGAERRAAQLMETVARAVDHGHRRGILHRDLKPANILLDEDSVPHVCDFGLARSLAQESELTQSGAVLGTPSYMSPEQAGGAGADLTVAADVWSLGAILYELLCGRPPHVGASPLEIVRRVVETDVAPLAASRDLTTIVMRCLEREPEARYATAGALAEDLGRWLRLEPIAARPVGRIERVAKWARRRPALAGLVAVSLIALVVILVGLAVFSSREHGLRVRAENTLRVARAHGLAAASHEASGEGRATRALLLAREAVRYHSDARTERRLRGALDAAPDAAVRFASRQAALGAFLQRPGTTQVLGWQGTWAAGDKTPRLFSAQGDVEVAFRGHTGRVQGVAFSGDGSRLVTASADRTVRVWDARGRQEYVHTGTHGVRCAVFAPDGASVLADGGASGGAVLWQFATNKVVPLALPERDSIESLGFVAGDKRVFAVTLNRRVVVWERSGRRAGTFELPRVPRGEQAPVSIAPDGQSLFATLPGGGLGRWDLTGRQVGIYGVRDGLVRAIAVAADGRSLLVAQGRRVRWYDVSGRLRRTFAAHDVPVTAIAMAVDGGMVVSGAANGQCRVWTATGQELARFAIASTAVSSLAIAAEGRVLSTAQFRTFLTCHDWRRSGTRVYRPDGKVASAAFGSDGQTVHVACHDGSVRALASERIERILIPPQFSARVARGFSRSESIYAAFAAGGPVLLMRANRFPLLSLVGHSAPVRTMDVDGADTVMVTGCAGGEVRLWAKDGTERWCRRGTAAVRIARFLAGGAVVTLRGSGEVTWWSAAGERLGGWSAGVDRVTVLRPDARGDGVLVGTRQGRVLRLASDGTVRQEFQSQPHAIGALSTCRGGVLVGTLAGTVRRFAAGGEETRVLLPRGVAVTDVGAVGDGAFFYVTFADGGARLCGATERDDVALVGTNAEERETAFVRSERSGGLVQWLRKGGVRLWHRKDARWLREDLGGNVPPVDVGISGDGTLAFAVGANFQQRSIYNIADRRLVSSGRGGVPFVAPRWLPGVRPMFAVPAYPAHRLYAESGRSIADVTAEQILAADGTGRLLTVKLGEHARLIDASGAKLREFALAEVSAGCFLGDRVVLAGAKGRIEICSRTADVVVPCTAHRQRVRRLIAAPQGGHFLSLSYDGTARLWSAAGTCRATLGQAGERTFETFRDKEQVHSAAFAADGAHLVTGSTEGVVRLHDLDGQVLLEVEAYPGGTVMAVAIAPDGATLASASGDGRVTLHRRDGSRSVPLRSHGGNVASLEFSPDGLRLLSAAWDGTVHVSRVRAADLLPIAADRIRRDFTAEELRDYGELLDPATRARARSSWTK